MSATLSKLRTSWVGRALLAYAMSALALVVLGLAAPGSAVFFPLVSLWCNLALFGLVLVVLRLADVKFDLFHWAVIIGFWAAALLYFYWAETRRSFVYIWDYVNYINKQYNALFNAIVRSVLFLSPRRHRICRVRTTRLPSCTTRERYGSEMGVRDRISI